MMFSFVVIFKTSILVSFYKLQSFLVWFLCVISSSIVFSLVFIVPITVTLHPDIWMLGINGSLESITLSTSHFSSCRIFSSSELLIVNEYSAYLFQSLVSKWRIVCRNMSLSTSSILLFSLCSVPSMMLCCVVRVPDCALSDWRRCDGISYFVGDAVCRSVSGASYCCTFC